MLSELPSANPNESNAARFIAEPSEESFSSIVNRAWERLWEKKRELSIRHIKELELTLLILEQELDQFIAQGKARGAHSRALRDPEQGK